ncbi:MAG: hypothetical protein HWE27_17425, partial [Gammaproteobacteria bacterium]|nr:hypothetical protein [Gammaproteobacteria bacterium]
MQYRGLGSLMYTVSKIVKIIGMLCVSLVVISCSETSDSDASKAVEQTVESSAVSGTTPIALVSRPMDRHADRLNEQFQSSVSQFDQSPLDLWSPYDVSRGAQLSLRSGLDVNASEDELLSAYFGSSDYDVKDLNLSPDGRTLLFA